jgi:hypothetical protein
MEYRRREPRFEIDQLVTITNLDRPDRPIGGRIANFSASGTRLVMQEELNRGTMVKVEWGTTVLLGEIIYCCRQGSEFAVGLELEDALYEKEEVASINQFWSPEPNTAKRV